MKTLCIVILLLYIVCNSVFGTSGEEYDAAYNALGKAFVEMPTIKEVGKLLSNKGYNMSKNTIGLDKHQLGFISGVGGSLVRGKVSTKVLKNFKLDIDKDMQIVPLVIYDINDGNLYNMLQFDWRF